MCVVHWTIDTLILMFYFNINALIYSLIIYSATIYYRLYDHS